MNTEQTNKNIFTYNKYRTLSEEEKEGKKRISKKQIQKDERKNKTNEYQAAKTLIFCIV